MSALDVDHLVSRTDDPLVIATDSGVRLLIINRPRVRNAMSYDFRRAYAEALMAAEVDEEVKVLIVTGAEGQFSAGVDMKDTRANPGRPLDPGISKRPLPDGPRGIRIRPRGQGRRSRAGLRRFRAAGVRRGARRPGRGRPSHLRGGVVRADAGPYRRPCQRAHIVEGGGSFHHRRHGPSPVPAGAHAMVQPFRLQSDMSVATRRRVFGECADNAVLFIGSHFYAPTAGRVVRDGQAFRFET